jgi:MFS family permease
MLIVKKVIERKPEMVRVVLIFCLYLSGVGAAAQISKMIPVFATFQVIYGKNLSDITLLMSAVSVASVVFGMMAGVLVNHFGMRRSIQICCIVSIAAGYVLPYSPNFYLTFVVRFMESFGHLGIVTSAPALMVSITKKRYVSVVLGIWASFFGIAFVFSQSLAQFFVFPNNYVIFLHAHVLLFLPTVFITCLWDNSNQSSKTGTLIIRPLPRLKPFPQLLSAISFLFHAGVFTTILTFAQNELTNRYGLAQNIAEFWAPIFPLISLSAIFIASFLLTFFGTFHLFSISVFFILFSVTLLSSYPVYAFCGIFFGVGIAQAAVFARINDVILSPEDTSIINGMFTQFGNLGNIIFPYVTALLIKQSTVINLFFIIGFGVFFSFFAQFMIQCFINKWRINGKFSNCIF